ncbi:MAG: carbamoyl-phosphate synthase domain-containing protein [Candidatus Limnocylindrales bacterium]
MSAHALAHHAPAAGGFCTCRRVIVPPSPRASAVVDPRIGDLGPALLALEDGTIFPGVAFGAPVAAGGDLVVNTSQTGYQEVCTDPSYAGQVVVMTYPLIGNYGRLVADDQSRQPWLRALVVANATAAVLDDARQLAALLRDDGIPAIAGVDTRALARHLRANGCLRGVVTAPGEVDREAALAAARAVARWEDQDFVSQVSPPRRDRVRCHRRGRSAGGHRGPGPEVEHRGGDAPSRRASPGLPAHGLGWRSARGRRGRRDPVAGSWGSRAVGGAGRPRPDRDRRRAAAPRDLSRAPDRRARGRRRYAAAAVRASRREPPRPGRGSRPRPGDGTEPRSPGRGRLAAGRVWLPGQPGQPQRPFRRGLRHREKPIETVQYHPEGAPGPLDALAVFDRFIAAVVRAGAA